MKQAVFHNGLQDEVGHQGFGQVGIDVVFHLQLGIPTAHQLHVGFQQLLLLVQGHHLLVDLHAEPEEIHQPHQKIGNLLIPAELGTDADGIQRIIKKMGIDLAFQVQHGHPLLCQFASQNGGVFQRQVEGHGHQGQAHAADEPGGIDGLQNRHPQLNGQRKSNDPPFLGVQILPVSQQRYHAENQIVDHAQVTHNNMDSVGVVPLRRLGVVDRQQQITR